MKQFQIIGEVRGLGGMCAVETRQESATREPAATKQKKLAQYCYEHGLITITAGTYGNVMRILVPSSLLMRNSMKVWTCWNQGWPTLRYCTASSSS